MSHQWKGCENLGFCPLCAQSNRWVLSCLGCHSNKHTHHLATCLLSYVNHTPLFYIIYCLHHIFDSQTLPDFFNWNTLTKGSSTYDTLHCWLSNSPPSLLRVYVDQHSHSCLLTIKWLNGNILSLLLPHGRFSYFKDFFHQIWCYLYPTTFILRNVGHFYFFTNTSVFSSCSKRA